MSVSRLALHHQGPTFSRLIMGYWRLMEWQLSPAALLDLMKYHLDLGVTTIDHADIYGGYQCEEAFGHALRLRNSVRPKSTGSFISQLRELEQIRDLITSMDNAIDQMQKTAKGVPSHGTNQQKTPGIPDGP